MDSTRTAGTRLVIAACLVVGLAMYALLVVSDYVLAKRRVSRLEHINVEARKIERERKSEDIAYIKDAREHGYQSLLAPSYFEQGKWRGLVETYGIAPLGPQPHTRVYYCHEGYGQVRYRTDRYGFRNDDSVWQLDVVDVMLVGDSFAQGACVDEPHSISGVLRLHGLSTINFGTGGNSPIQYAAIIKTFVKAVKPRTLVVVFCPNDNTDDEQSVYNDVFFKNQAHYFEDGVDKRYVDISDRLKALYEDAERLMSEELSKGRKEGPPRVSVPRRVISHLQLTTLRTVTAEAVNMLLRRDSLPYSTKLTIDVAVSECGEVGCTPIFVYVPSSELWSVDSRAQKYSELLSAYGQAMGTSGVLNVSEPLKNLGLAAYAPKGPHLSPAGYRIVSDAISKTVDSVKDGSATHLPARGVPVKSLD